MHVHTERLWLLWESHKGRSTATSDKPTSMTGSCYYNNDNLALELKILHDRLTSAYRRLMLIASNEEFSEDRIDAETASCEVALAIAKLAFEGPIVLKDFGAYLR